MRLSSVKFRSGRGIISYEMGSDGTGGKHLYLDKEDSGKLKMNGREVFKFAVRIMGDAFKNTCS